MARSSRRETPAPAAPAAPAVEVVAISDEVIRLGQFLKLANLVDSGADARELVAEGEVTVNGETETRRGRQLGRGDVVGVSTPQGVLRAQVG